MLWPACASASAFMSCLEWSILAMSLQQSHFSFIFSQHSIFLGAGAGAVCALATAGRAIDIAIAIIILFIGNSVKIG